MHWTVGGVCEGAGGEVVEVRDPGALLAICAA